MWGLLFEPRAIGGVRAERQTGLSEGRGTVSVIPQVTCFFSGPALVLKNVCIDFELKMHCLFRARCLILLDCVTRCICHVFSFPVGHVC